MGAFRVTGYGVRGLRPAGLQGGIVASVISLEHCCAHSLMGKHHSVDAATNVTGRIDKCGNKVDQSKVICSLLLNSDEQHLGLVIGAAIEKSEGGEA